MEKNSITFVQLLKFFRSKRVTLSCYNVRITPVFVFPDPGPLLGSQARIISSKTSHTDIHKIQRCQSNTSSSRQYCSLNIVDENGRYSKSENRRVGQGRLRISFEKGITTTAEYLPSKLNLTADQESRNTLDSFEWMLSHQIFQKVSQIRDFLEINLFASRLSHQIPSYVALKPDSHSHATDAFQQNWSQKFLYAFPPFA